MYSEFKLFIGSFFRIKSIEQELVIFGVAVPTRLYMRNKNVPLVRSRVTVLYACAPLDLDEEHAF